MDGTLTAEPSADVTRTSPRNSLSSQSDYGQTGRAGQSPLGNISGLSMRIQTGDQKALRAKRLHGGKQLKSAHSRSEGQ